MTTTLLPMERRVFEVYSFDRGFLEYYRQRAMNSVEVHYKYSLRIARESDSRAYRALLPVIYKWLDDAYLEFGFREGHKALILHPISDGEFEQDENAWRRRGIRCLGFFPCDPKDLPAPIVDPGNPSTKIPCHYNQRGADNRTKNSGEYGTCFPSPGYYKFFEYFLELRKAKKGLELFTGSMPPNLEVYLIHYLEHASGCRFDGILTKKAWPPVDD